MKLRRIGFGRLCLAASAAILVIAPVALSAQSDDRRRAVGDWLVEDVGDGSGGRTLRIMREEGDFSLDYHMNISPGADDFASQGFMVWRLNCGQGGEESLDGGVSRVEARAIRARLAEYLGRCETPAPQSEALLRDFDRAFALLTEWAPEARASALADSGMAAGDNDMAMADYIEGTDMNMDMGMDMNATYTDAYAYENMTDMSMDMNMTTDMNYSEDEYTNVTMDEPN